MNKEFGKLVNEYEQVKTNSDAEELERILSKMRENLKNRIREDKYSINIAEATFEDLLKINAELNMAETSDKMKSVSDASRQQQQDKNKYRPNNPYPQKD